MWPYLLAPLMAFALSFGLTPLAIRAAHRFGVVDVPKDERKVHKEPIPLMGGLAIFLAFFVVMMLFRPLPELKLYGLMLASLLIVSMGLLDDKYDLPAKVKLAVQLIAALMLYRFGFQITFLTDFFQDQMQGIVYLEQWVSLPLTLLWIVGITNTVNLIDGLDGLAAGVAVIAAITLSYVAFISGRYEIMLLTLILTGATLGFLPFNFNPAKIFMGDTGAYLLGLVLAAASIEGALKSATFIAFIIPILALGLPIFDTAFAIVRRFVQGKGIMEADKGHLHHRLLHFGLDHKRVVLTLYLLSTLLGISAIQLMVGSYTAMTVLLLLAALIVIIPLTRMEANKAEMGGFDEEGH